MNDILCPTDLSETSLHGLRYADHLASRFASSISLLHVMGKKELTEEGRSNAKDRMEQQRSQITKSPTVVHFREGDFISEIADESRKGHSLMVCTTHGLRGLRQSLFGADILKLVRHVEVPTLVVQAKSPEQNSFAVIVMPVAAHPDIEHLLTGVALLAKTFGSTVHVYQLVRPGESPSDELLANKARMVEWLGKEGIAVKTVEEPSTSFSVGFSWPTIDYAKRVGAGCIVIMSVASDEYRYIADAEKERLLINEPGIPVLCAK